MCDDRLLKRIMSEELKTVEEEAMDRLRGRGPSDVWHDGGLEYCHTAVDPGAW